MARIISATTRFSAAGGGTQRADFIAKARELLTQAVQYREAGEWGEALECAYRAGLRTAGARISSSATAGRKRRSSSAWERLKVIDDDGARWATAFGQYSRLRSRVSSGIERDVDHEVVDHLIELATEFLAEVEVDVGWFPTAA